MLLCGLFTVLYIQWNLVLIKTIMEPKPLFFKILSYVWGFFYEVAPEEVADHCVLEGRAARLHTSTTPVLFGDNVSDEPIKKKVG